MSSSVLSSVDFLSNLHSNSGHIVDEDPTKRNAAATDFSSLLAVANEAMWQNFGKNLIKEKKKFNTEVSDVLVTEVLKRKDLLVENNTSRDLTFSENKRVAWNEVRGLLMSRFEGFDLSVEAIKSHWRYRKRKVTDAHQELKSGDSENKLHSKLSPVDWDIFHMLKESNLLDKKAENSSNTNAASPSEGEDVLSEHHYGNNSRDQTTPTPSLTASSTVTNMAEHQQRMCIERLAAVLLGRNGGIPTTPSTESFLNANDMLLHAGQNVLPNGEEPKIDDLMHSPGSADSGISATNSISRSRAHTPMSVVQKQPTPVPASTEFNVCELLRQSSCLFSSSLKRSATATAFTVTDSEAAISTPTTSCPPMKRQRSEEIQEIKEVEEPKMNYSAQKQPPCSFEECQQQLAESQRETLDELRGLIVDVRHSLLPQLVMALEKYNKSSD